jgi:hypothetical protein
MLAAVEDDLGRAWMKVKVIIHIRKRDIITKGKKTLTFNIPKGY